MKLSKEQKEAIFSCVKDLENYYETCGNEMDFQNLEFLKIYLNTISLGIENIEVIAEIVKTKTAKNK